MGSTQASGSLMGFGDAMIVAVMGYIITFVGIILLIGLVVVVNKIMMRMQEKSKVAADVEKSAPAPVKKAAPAPGSAGQVKLYNVSDKDAAMLMAIVANKMGKPLNELRFISIKEVDSEQ